MNIVLESPARTKVDLLTRKLEALHEDLTETEGKLELLPARQHEARVAAISKAPTIFSGKVGSEPLKLAREQETLEAKLDNLRLEISATTDVLTAENRRKLTEELRPVITKAREFTATEQEAWIELGRIEEQRLTVINRLFEAAEARDVLLLQTEAQVADCDDPVLAEEAREALSPPVSPFPSDTIEVSLTVIEACCDPGRRYREEGEVERLDGKGFLLAELPDLRHLLRTAALSGRVDRRHSSRRAQEGFNLLPAR